MDPEEDVIIISCQWCSEPGFSTRHLYEFITKIRDKKNLPGWIKDADSDLCSCFDCVEEFHHALELAFSNDPHVLQDVVAFKKLAYVRNITRLSEHLSRTQERIKLQRSSEVEEEEVAVYLKKEVETPLLEILKYPRLLLDRSLCSLFVEVFKQLQAVEKEVEVDKKFPGVYLLLVHPDEQVRRWSVRVVQSLDPVDWDDYDELEEVIHWLMRVLICDLFSEPCTDVGSSGWDDNQIVLLPIHLYTHKCPKDFWVGMCMLLSSLDSTCVRSKLVSASSGHPEFISIVTAALNCSSSCSITKRNKSVFFPALKSLAVLLERLGSRFWQFTDSRDPETVLDAIILNRVFLEKIEEMCSSVCVKAEAGNSNDEDNMTNSQLVYQWENDDDDDIMHAGSNAESVVFCWVVPFLQSLLDFGSFMDVVVQRMFAAISSELARSCGVAQLPESTVLYRETLMALAGMVSLLYSKEAYTLLLSVSDSWLKPLTKSLFSVHRLSALPCHVETAVSIFRKILNTDSASHFSQSTEFLSCLQEYQKSFFHGSRQSAFHKSTCNVVKKEFSSRLFSDHLTLVLRTLSMQNDRGSLSEAEKVSTSKCTPRSVDPVSPSKPHPDSPPIARVKQEQTESERTVTSTERFPVNDFDYNVTEETKVFPNPKILSNQPVAVKESNRIFFVGKLSAKERTSGNSSSTDEMEEWECGPRRKPTIPKNIRRNLSLRLKKSTPTQSLKAKSTNSTSTKQVITSIASTYNESEVSTPAVSDLSGDDLLDTKPRPLGIKPSPLSSRAVVITERASPSSVSSSDDSDFPSLNTLMTTPTKNSFGKRRVNIGTDICGTVSKARAELDGGLIPQKKTAVSKAHAELDGGLIPQKKTAVSKAHAELDGGSIPRKKTAVSKAHAELDGGLISRKKTAVVTSSEHCVSVQHEQTHDELESGVCIANDDYFSDSEQSECKGSSRFIEDSSLEDIQKNCDSSQVLTSSERKKEQADSSLYYQGKKESQTEIDKPDTLVACNESSLHVTKPDSQSDPDFVYYNLRDIIETHSPVSLATESDTTSDGSKGDNVCKDNSHVVIDKIHSLTTLIPSVQPKSSPKPSPIPSENSVGSSRDMRSLTGSPVTVDLVRLNNESISKINLQLRQTKSPQNLSSKLEIISNMNLASHSSSSDELCIPLLSRKRRWISPVSSDSDQSPICHDQDKELSTPTSTLSSKRMKWEPEKATRTVAPANQDFNIPGDRDAGSTVSQHKPVHADSEISINKPGMPPKCKVSHVTGTATQLYEPPGIVYSGRKSVLMRSTGSADKNAFKQHVRMSQSVPKHALMGSVSSVSASKEITSHSDEKIDPGSHTKAAPKFSALTKSSQCSSKPDLIGNKIPSKSVAKLHLSDYPSEPIDSQSNKRKPTVTFSRGASSPTLNKLSTDTANLLDNATRRPNLDSMIKQQFIHQQPKPDLLPRLNIDTRPKKPKSMDDFHSCVLSWDPSVFRYPEQDEEGRRVIPTCRELLGELEHVPLTFTSYDKYFDVFKPLFFLELWQSVFENIGDSYMKQSPCTGRVQSVAYSRNYRIIKVLLVMSREKARQYAHPNERDLVIFDAGDRTSGGLFAFVENHKHTYPQQPGGKREGVSKCEVLIGLKLLGPSRTSLSLEGSIVTLSVVMSLSTEIRQWNGLINFHNSPLARDILHPRGGTYFCQSTSQPVSDETQIKVLGRYNPSQSECIKAAAKAVCAPYMTPKMFLLQGPPGTGKTHTISGLIRTVFQELQRCAYKPITGSLPGQRTPVQQKPHILVCAPSNAAVDEVIRKMMKDGFVKMGSGQQLSSGLTVVRIGSQEKIHSQIRPLSLDELAKRRVKSTDRNATSSTDVDNLRQQISSVERDIDEAEKQYFVQSRSNSHHPHSEPLKDKIERLKQKKDKLTGDHRQSRLKQNDNKREESQVRKKILMEADIVCATLCGSGSSALRDCVRSNRSNPLHFSCVIVDEAAQCTELDVLVPLLYQCSKIILVGDPLQLPATVRSRQAEEFGYGRSLFERLYQHFSKKGGGANPVRMLNVQYRMLPEICYFPSAHFYSNQLQTDSSVLSAARECKVINPFLMFNVLAGTEESVERSMRNREECHCLVAILKALNENGVAPNTIGVITPYRAQQKLVEEQLAKLLPQLPKIDIGTVDGFQGREKEVVILSCVRARSQSGSVGFLCNRQRLNVSLTRAKKALYVLGHLHSLEVDSDWLALIKHAEHCNAVIEVNDFYEAAKSIMKDSVQTSGLRYQRSTLFDSRKVRNESYQHCIARTVAAQSSHGNTTPRVDSSEHRCNRQTDSKRKSSTSGQAFSAHGKPRETTRKHYQTSGNDRPSDPRSRHSYDDQTSGNDRPRDPRSRHSYDDQTSGNDRPRDPRSRHSYDDQSSGNDRPRDPRSRHCYDDQSSGNDRPRNTRTSNSSDDQTSGNDRPRSMDPRLGLGNKKKVRDSRRKLSSSAEILHEEYPSESRHITPQVSGVWTSGSVQSCNTVQSETINQPMRKTSTSHTSSVERKATDNHQPRLTYEIPPSKRSKIDSEDTHIEQSHIPQQTNYPSKPKASESRERDCSSRAKGGSVSQANTKEILDRTIANIRMHEQSRRGRRPQSGSSIRKELSKSTKFT